MKTLIVLLVLYILPGCVTPPLEDTQRIVDLNVTRTITPITSTIAQGITSEVRVTQSDLCYAFGYFLVKNPSGLIYEISAKGTYPTGNPACPQTLYVKDTTLKIQTPVAGTYVLKFYNGNNLFKSDTVHVN